MLQSCDESNWGVFVCRAADNTVQHITVQVSSTTGGSRVARVDSAEVADVLFQQVIDMESSVFTWLSLAAENATTLSQLMVDGRVTMEEVDGVWVIQQAEAA